MITTWKFNVRNTVCNPWIKGKPSKITNYLDNKERETSSLNNLWGTEKAILKGNFKALSNFFNK